MENLVSRPDLEKGADGALRLLAVLCLAVFLGEAAIMTALPYLNIGVDHIDIGPAIVDSTLLTALLFPILYLFIVRKLAREKKALARSERELRTVRRELEQRVTERTGELDVSLEKLKSRQHEMVLLAEMNHRFQGCLNRAEAQAVALDKLPRLLPGVSGSLFLLNSSHSALCNVASWGALASSQDFFEPESCWAMRYGTPYLVSAENGGVPCNHMNSDTKDGQLCLPLAAQGEALGVLYLQGDIESECLVPGGGQGSSEQMLFCESIAECLAMSFANVRLREELQHQAIRDPLTGLFNRRYLVETLELELQKSTRSGQPVSLAMLDIDHFKRFNDTYGHDAGDTLIAELGKFLGKGAREGDIISRYGGEEFVIVMPDAPADVAMSRIDSLRREIESLAVHHQGQPLGRITISAGIATYPTHKTNGGTILNAADRAMYQSKQQGRNRVTLAASPPNRVDPPQDQQRRDNAEGMAAQFPLASIN